MRLIEAAVVLVIFEERTLVLRRHPQDRSFAHRWCLPGGTLDPSESPVEAAVRESCEETGLGVQITCALGPERVEHPGRGVEFSIHRFVGLASGVNYRLSDEHVDGRWLNRDAAMRAERDLEGGLAGAITGELLRRFGRSEF